MISIRNTVLALLVAGFGIGTGCSLAKSLGEMGALRQQLIRKYHDEVAVNLQNSRYLSVTFINSPLNGQNSAKRLERAQDAARFVALKYEGIKSVDAMWISFMASESHFIVYHHNRIIDAFVFDRNGASLDAETTRGNATVYDEARKDADARAPVIHYIPSTNETDISITRIQLEGDINKGIALAPHFAVSGDARNLGTATPLPEFVVLDFASYSPKPIFEANPTIEILCDGRLALKGVAQLWPAAASGTDESIAQFLSSRVSFKVFRRMAKSKSVTIKLGPKQFQLLPDDVDALSRMAAYVPDLNNGD